MSGSNAAMAARNDTPFQTKLAHYLVNALVYGLLRLALSLPYDLRVRLFGYLVSDILGPAFGYHRRAVDHLAHVFPDMELLSRKSVATACLNNAGRTLIENYSTRDMAERMKDNPLTGPGLAAFNASVAEGRPVILVSGHFGNYESTRAALVARGHDIGALYRNLSNPYFNAHYVRTLEDLGGPVFAQGLRGTAGFTRHLKAGGQMVLLFDQHVFGAPVLDFMGRPARTAISAAKLALKYDATLIPFYGIRRPDGIGFDTVLDAPIVHSSPLEMTQEMNDGLSARIRETPEQWLWFHRRWRPESA